MTVTKLLLSQPSAGHATIAAVSPLFEEGLERHCGALTFPKTQVEDLRLAEGELRWVAGHGCFGRFLFHIKLEDTPGCHHCGERPEDTLEHTVDVCPAWVEHRRVLVVAIGGNFPRPALVQTMVRSENASQAVISFCEAVMLAKEEAERVRERKSQRTDK